MDLSLANRRETTRRGGSEYEVKQKMFEVYIRTNVYTNDASLVCFPSTLCSAELKNCLSLTILMHTLARKWVPSRDLGSEGAITPLVYFRPATMTWYKNSHSSLERIYCKLLG